MWRIVINTVTVLLLLQCGSLFAKIPRQEYSYEAHVHGKSFADTESTRLASYYGIFGKLIFHYYDDKVVAQFSDLTTTTYNGPEDYIERDAKKLAIPDSASALYKPFVLSYFHGEVPTVGLQPDDLYWSKNIKKAVASILQVNSDAVSEHTKNVTEWSIYGNCDIQYDLEEKDDVSVLTKTINDCSEGRSVSTTNLQTEYPGSYDGLASDVVRIYTVKKNGYIDKIRNILRVESYANTTLKTMPTDRRTHHIIQKQIFKLLDYSEVDFVFNFSQTVDENFTIIYESVETKENVAELVEKLISVFEQYDDNIYPEYVKNYNFSNDLPPKLYNLVTRISNSITDQSTELGPLLNNTAFMEFFKLYVPYIGDTAALEYIKEAIKDHIWHSTDIMKIMSTMPRNILLTNEEALENLEYLLRLGYHREPLVRYTATINYGSAVEHICRYRNETCQKYVDEFVKLMKDSKRYDLRMMYMLGVANLASLLEDDFILTLITNLHEYPQLRELATYAFKYALTDSEKVFKAMWPIVNNKTEQLGVRVSALDLIQSLKLTDEQFNTILDSFSKYSSDHNEQHLYNYFYTSTLSEENKTRFDDDRIKMPQSYRTIGTAKYNLDYHSPEYEFAGDFVTRIIANPNTNYIDTIIFSKNSYAMNLRFSKYTIYFKMEGFLDAWNHDFHSASAIPDLLKLIKKNNFQLKDSLNAHIDFVIFDNERAVIAYHVDSPRLDYVIDLLASFLENEGISFPLWHYQRIVSDLGTNIEYLNEINQFLGTTESRMLTDFDFNIIQRQMYIDYDWKSYIGLTLENPISGVKIGTKDVKSIAFALAVPYYVYPDHIRLQNDNVTLSAVVDIAVATVALEPEVLQKYCADCKSYHEFPQDNCVKYKYPVEMFGSAAEINATFSGYQRFNISFIKAIILADFKGLRPTDVFFVWDQLVFKPPVDTLHLSLWKVPLYDEPTESKFKVDVSKKLKPIQLLAPPQVEVSVSYLNKKVSDGSLLRFWNLTTSVDYKPKSIGTGKLHSNITMHIDNTYKNGTKHKVCVIADVIYPVPRTQMYSLVSSKPTKIKYTVAHGTDKCDIITNDFSMLLSVTDEQKQYVNTLPEFDVCKKQSEGLQFLPPTKECIKISHILSQYRRYDFNYKYTIESDSDSEISEIKYVERQQNGALTFGIKDADIKIIMNGTDTRKAMFDNYAGELILFDSIDRWIYDKDVKWGFQSNCFITPNYIKTFTGGEITNYEDQDNEKLVAFVECINATRNGLVFTKLDDKHVAFKLWLEDSVISATRSHDKVQAILNGKLLKTGDIIKTDSYRVFMFTDDTMYIYSDLVGVYYNTEYVMVKVYSNYNSYVCGLCAHNY